MAPPLALLLFAALALSPALPKSHGGGFYDPRRVTQLSSRPR